MPTQSFKVGEMLNKRTRNSKTWINFDGSYTTEIHMGDVHFPDEAGNLHNINTDLYDEADFDVIDEPVSREGVERFKQSKKEAKAAKNKAVLNRDNFNFQALRVPFECHIPRNFQRGYTIGKGNDKITFKPVKSSPAKGYLNENDRSVITYQDVWNDTDVELKVQTNGLKETIVLKTDRAPSSFSFEVQGKDIADDFTAGELKLMPAWLKDADGTERDVEMVINRQNDNKVYVELNAEVSDLVYPIEIDPTVILQPYQTVKDSWIYSNTANLDTNYGSATTMRIGRTSLLTAKAYLQFDLSSIPLGSDVTNAILSLYYYSGWAAGTTDLTVSKVTTNWDENTITWNNQPTISSEFESQLRKNTSPTGVWFDFTVTNITNEYTKGIFPNFGYVIDSLPGGAGGFTVNSSDHSDSSSRPKLTITYDEPPTAPTVITPNGGETWNSLHRVEWESSKDAIETPVIDTGYSNPHANTGTADSITSQIGQSFYAPKTFYLDKIDFYLYNYVADSEVDIQLYSLSGGLPSTLLFSERTSFSEGTTNAEKSYSYKFNTPYQLQSASGYAIVFSFVNQPVKCSIGANTYSNGSYVYNSPVWQINASYDFRMKIYEYTTNLQYEIQLSTDNGANWKDIVALTTAGATTYDYDFINEPETSLAMVRIRAYDGSSYGPWDESDGVFTIVHNQAPTAPTNLSPSGSVLDRAAVNRLSWQHNDANLDPQAQFDLQWRLQGSPSWNTVSRVTVNQYWDAPANTFPKGVIEWQVRTYDQAGLSSPYSGISVFNAGDKPANPIITSPADASTVSVANPTVQWSSVGQTGYHLKVLDTDDTLLWESIKTSNNKAETVLYDLQNGTDYIIQLAIKNADGLLSDFVAVNIHVSYTPPAKAMVTTSTDTSRGSITLAIDNPVPVGTEPAVSYNSVFRRRQGELEFIRIATNIPDDGTFTDHTPACDEVYEYYVRTWGDNGTYSDSDNMGVSVNVKNAQLALVSNYSQWVEIMYNSDRKVGKSYERTLSQFAGRKDPVAEYGEHEDLGLSLAYKVLDKAEVNKLIALCDKKEIMLYRDSRGRREFVTVDGVEVSDESPNYYSVSLSPSKVSFSEVV